MINSMTGYGRGQADNERYQLTVEIKSVNHRFLETNIRLPRALAFSEDALKKHLQTVFSRGKIDVFVSFSYGDVKKSRVLVDKELAIAYHYALTEVAGCCSLPPQVELAQIASAPGVLTVETAADDEEEIFSLLLAATETACAQLADMRFNEGERLAADLSSRLQTIGEYTAKIARLAPQVVQEQKLRLEQRLADILGAIAIDEARLANEIAYFADKVDISEELTRLDSHCQQFRSTLDAAEAVGRKLEFILQEMLREINTIGSKSNALDINRCVIEVKSELEKMREQIQNVE